MPDIDVVDSTWLAGRPSTVAALVADPANWRRWWPDLDLQPTALRGDKGVRWTVRSVRGQGCAGLHGSAEVWLEPMFEGVVAHFFLRLDAAPGGRVTRRLRDEVIRSQRVSTKRSFWALADQLDPGRADRHVSASHASVQ